MSRRVALLACAISALTLGASACASQQNIRCRQFAAQPATAGIPSFVFEALLGSDVKRAKLYLDANGRFHKWAAYVDKAAIPAWAHAAADAKLGKGEDISYEIEQYGTGEKVYEVTRKVGDKTLELSINSDTQKPLYIEKKGLATDAMPAAIKAAAAKVTGLTAETYTLKEYTSGKKVHEVYGKIGGKPYKLYFDETGKLKRKQLQLTATLAVTR